MMTTSRFLMLLALVLACPALTATATPLKDAGITYGYVHLNVTEVEVRKAFWGDHFGGAVVERGSSSGVGFPGTVLLFTERAPTGGSQKSVMDHFGFNVKDTTAVLAKWRAAGLEVQSELTGAEGFPNAYMMGPDSVRIEIQEDKTQPEDVIAYPIHFTPDYESLMAWYVDAIGVEPFQRETIAGNGQRSRVELQLRNVPGAATPHARPIHRSYRLRSARPGGVRPSVRGEGRAFRRAHPRGREHRTQDRVPDGSLGRVRRTDGRADRLLRSPRESVCRKFPTGFNSGRPPPLH